MKTKNSTEVIVVENPENKARWFGCYLIGLVLKTTATKTYSTLHQA